MMFVCVHVKCAKMVPFHKSGHNGILQYIGIAQKLFQIDTNHSFLGLIHVERVAKTMVILEAKFWCTWYSKFSALGI